MSNTSIGIDLGSETTRVVIGEFLKREKIPKIIGFGESKSAGVRHGYVTDPALAAASIREAINQAEKISGVKIKSALVSAGGMSLRGDQSTGSVVVGKANGEVTGLDIKRALEDSEDNLKLGNRKIIHTFPVSFRLDGKEVAGRVEGMRGTKLEARVLFITYSSQHLEDLLDAMALARVESSDLVAWPVAVSDLALSEKQKVVGSALVNIGSESTGVAVYENGSIVSLHTFSIGAEDITNDIALGFKLPLEEAEQLKLGNSGTEYPKKKLDEIIEARLSDIFELIENHLKKIKRNELLPGGIVFTGGGANVGGLVEFSKRSLSLPARTGTIDLFGSAKTKLRDPAWLTALGLVHWSRNNLLESEGSLSSVFKDLRNGIKSVLKQLMP